MQRALLLLLLPMMFLSSCSYYDHKTKQSFYDLLSGTNDSLDRMTADWHQLLDKATISKNFSALGPLRTKMGLFMSRNRAKVADIEVPPNSEALRDSEEVFLSSQAAVISDVYPPFEPFNDITPDGDIQNQLRLVSGDQETESAGTQTIRKSLDALAQRNKLKTSTVTR